MDSETNAGWQPETSNQRDIADDAEVDDLVRLQGYATDLADGIERAIPGWVAREVARLHQAWVGGADQTGAGPAANGLDNQVLDAGRAAGARAQAEIGPQVRRLLAQDIDDQRSNPLALVRRVVVYPTEVLRAAGVPPVVRDAQAEQRFPDDDYDLTPTSFADLDPGLHEPGLHWGAAKAHVHLRRRRAEGQR